MASDADLSEEVEPTALANLHCIEWVRSRVTLPGYASDMWKEDHQVIVSDFLATNVENAHSRLILCMTDEGLKIQYNVPADNLKAQMMYFLRDPTKEVNQETIDVDVQYGMVNGETMESLLRLMNSVYVPVFTSNSTWPDSVRKEFSGHLQRFMANLTETAYEVKGSTILYVPTEEISSVAAAAKDKDQVHRLDSTIIHWTRQIQDVINSQDSGDNSEDAGPLSQIQFWKSRTVDLSGIREQLTRPGVTRIVEVLTAVQSTYLPPFNNLVEDIKSMTSVAEDNCKFLQLLQEPCEKLAASEPKEIPPLLPHILRCIRMIWSTCEFYKVPDRLTRLLRNVSNELIHRCRAKVSLEEVFNGNAEAAVVALTDSISCIEQWKKCYDDTVELVKRKGATWDVDIDVNNVFAHVFAFMQRCRDLLEVCEGRLQFAPKYATGDDTAAEYKPPIFSGPNGGEIVKSLEDIEASFTKHLDDLRKLEYDILDVTNNGWHDDHAAFNAALKHLEVMTQKVIRETCAVENLPSVANGVELLEAFHMLAKRENIKMCVDMVTGKVYKLFIDEVGSVKKEFDAHKLSPPIHRSFPKFSGASLWAKGLRDRIQAQMDTLDAAHYLTPCPEAEEAKHSYTVLSGALTDFSNRMHILWLQQLVSDGVELSKRLDIKLLRKDAAGDTLLLNFDPHLLRFYNEIIYWTKQNKDIPYSKDVQDLVSNSDKMRVLRENVGFVVRDFNNIITSLTKLEMKLFQERIFHLERKVQPGLTKYTWAQKPPMLMQYKSDCRKYCREVFQTVTTFKANHEKITKCCGEMSKELLVTIMRKRVYDDGEFEAAQAEHRAKIQAILEKCYSDINETLKSSKEIFAQDSPAVQAEWVNYCMLIDKSIEESLRSMVKRSLTEIAKAINGDAKTEVSPLFKMNVVLAENEAGNSRVTLKPSTSDLSKMVNNIASELITVIKVVPRVTEIPTPPEPEEGEEPEVVEPLVTFYETILNDKDILEKTMVSIMEGMQGNVDKTMRYMASWDKYKTIWERSKDKFMDRYASQKRDVATFETDITFYKNFEDEIKGEETIKNVAFVRLDCAPLKQQLVDHCIEWQRRFTHLLNDISLKELDDLHEMFKTNAEILAIAPKDLDQLASEVNLLQSLQGRLPEIEAQFKPLEDQYKCLAVFDVAVEEEELGRLDGVTPAWEDFQAMLAKSETKLEKSKTNFRVTLMNNLEAFTDRVAKERADFKVNGPWSGELTPAQATANIVECRAKCAEMRTVEKGMEGGLGVFEMDIPEYKSIEETEEELKLLEANWALMSEWLALWDTWKFGTFKAIDVDDMEAASNEFNKKITKAGRAAGVKSWGVWQSVRGLVDNFKATLPLITDLKNPALRDRHWEALQTKVGKKFDPESDDFTLEKVFDLKLFNFADEIAVLSNDANKELAIEVAVTDITRIWTHEMEFIVKDYKDKGHHLLQVADEFFQQLEDNQVGVSTMKASKFSISFRDELSYWEKALSQISEVVDQCLNVQRQWMYLENIFVGSEDIARQLPAETKMFEEVNSNFKLVMDGICRQTNALKASHVEGVLDMLNLMDSKLENIQKSLDAYLEKKRMRFPRFYFISNDDLLEILGQARNPNALQAHFKKMFEGIQKVTMIEPSGAKKNYEGVAIVAPDMETVPYHEPVIVQGQVEDWLNYIEGNMRHTMHDLLLQTFLSQNPKGSMKMKKDKWVREWPGGLLITANQMAWTTDCEKGLLEVMAGDKQAMRRVRKAQVKGLTKFAEMLKGKIDKILRNKLMGIVTIEVHSRDVLEKLVKGGCSNIQDFDWLQQLRAYWDKDVVCMDGAGWTGGAAVFNITNTKTNYGHEYQGNNGRLVVTPLTDRCYMTLTTALSLQRGGLPQGPAGTGKTETVKDLGKAIANYVIVFNCSDGLDFKSMGRMFAGLAQTGSWSCFDEFNRIDVEVLSVVAQQILCILDAIKARQTTVFFEGTEMRLNWGCGIFVTMNPGYAGRSELPENLTALLRPVSMMKPELALIIEVMLFANCFSATNSKDLAKKMFTLYDLCVQQLSKQDHYDFGLRNISGVMRAAGGLKLKEPALSEEMVLFRTLRDMNMPKYIKADTFLFMQLMGDIFQGVEPPPVDYGQLGATIEQDLIEHGYQATPHAIKKVIELYDAKSTRHCNMLIGRTGGGKSVACRTLCRVKEKMHKLGAKDWYPAKEYVINPKALSDGELYGNYNAETREWTDGVLSVVMRNICADEKPNEKWLVLDGPVDTLWIESMNTVMDDNKMLTLISGERIALPTMVTLVFEVQDLSVASPATVSRAGMLYFDVLDTGFESYLASWYDKKKELGEQGRDLTDLFKRLFEKYIDPLLLFKLLNCSELVATADLQAVQSLTELFDACNTPANGIVYGEEDWAKTVEIWFVYCTIWSVGGVLDEASRKKFDACLREIDAQFPSKGSVYDYFISPEKKAWRMWESKLSATWRPKPNEQFFKILVPTVDTLRNNYITTVLMKARKHTLLVGGVGNGKTSCAQLVLNSFDESIAKLVLNFSAQTSSNNVQDIIEGKLEKRTKENFGPPGGKKMITLIDDLNMPQKDLFGSHPPLELLRMWMDYGFWYDREKQVSKNIQDMHILACMGPPGGGRTEISGRFQSQFHVINCTQASEGDLKKIFSTLLNLKLVEFDDDDIKKLGDIMTAMLIGIFNTISDVLLPTPSKPVYLFNMRDMSKVVQGVLQADKDYFDTRDSMLRLFVHETTRVFGDRLNTLEDRAWLQDQLDAKLQSSCDTKWSSLFKDGGTMTNFGSFMRPMENPPYEEILDHSALKFKLEESLEDYNTESGGVEMKLVLFKDAIDHVCKINRVLKQPRGNMLLVGVGGSGRQSLTRLASSMAEMKVFSIEITKQYKTLEFHEDLKMLFVAAGVEKKQMVFLFNDTQVVQESFLEDINNILTSGEVPNLFPPDELAPIRDGVRNDAKAAGVEETPDALFAFFIDQARANLHVVLAMSYIGDSFRNRVRMFPGLVNCTTIDWFLDWPPEALKEVALRFLDDVDLSLSGGDEVKDSLSDVFQTVHTSVTIMSKKMLSQLNRMNYVTPTNFLELVKGYRMILSEKQAQVGDAASKLRNGLDKLASGAEEVKVMSVTLEEKKIVVGQAQKECEELLVVIVQDKRAADEQEKSVSLTKDKIDAEAVIVKGEAAIAMADLNAALPALQAAQDALDALDKKDISEMKAYTTPPPAVEMVLCAVMILRRQDPTWKEAKKQLGDSQFLGQLQNFNKDLLTDQLLKKVEKYTKKTEPCKFEPETVGKISGAAKSLCMWVIAMEVYGKIAKTVEPKRLKVKKAQQDLEKKQKALNAAEKQLKEVQEKVANLNIQYNDSVANKTALVDEAELLELKLTTAEKLIGGLAGERVRWESNITLFDAQMVMLVGDCLAAAAFLSYAGPFPADYRDALVVDTWLVALKQKQVPSSGDFTMVSFLSRPTDVQFWNIQGLPTDDFSTENGILTTRGERWPLMIDPQRQANKWIKNKEKANDLRMIDLKMSDFLRTVENAITFGTPVLLQDIQTEIDPALEPVLGKQIVNNKNRLTIKLGDKDLDYNPDFKLYITTRLGNPHYTPEISTKATIINFAVKQKGLEEQLLGTLVAKERFDLQTQKSELVLKLAEGRGQIVDLEDELLRLLSEVKGSLLDDADLLITLERSKVTSEEVTKQIAEAEEVEVTIDAARELYRPGANLSSLLYFVLADLTLVDPMYQFSLDSYINLFSQSIDNAPRNSVVEERVKAVNEYHTYAVYQNTCIGLFERHKLLFSFLICCRIKLNEDALPLDELDFLLRGGSVLDKSTQPPNPCPDWVTEAAWDNITELSKNVGSFNGLDGSFEQYGRDWAKWYTTSTPEVEQFPGDWENKCNEFQRLIVLRCLRADRVTVASTSWIINNMNHQKFVEPPAFDLEAIYQQSNTLDPLIFVLSTGVDPTKMLQQAAIKRSLGDRFSQIALGQGQAPRAVGMIENGVKVGGWVFLANCHLMTSWLPKLEKIIDEFPSLKPHPEFRLWLSSSPTPKFPIAILQQGLKMTTEPPKGLKANLIRLYNNIDDDTFNKCSKPAQYKRLFFALCYFHSSLLERKKFLNLGWNVMYSFNDPDFEICEAVLCTYLDEYDDVKWEAMRYLTSEANYGGRVTDDWDRRLMNTYMEQFYHADVISTDNHRLSTLPEYYIPDDGSKKTYIQYIKNLPVTDVPEAFGQHPNAAIASQIADSGLMLSTLLGLQSGGGGGGGKSPEEIVDDIAADLISKLPADVDARSIGIVKSDDPSALNTVLVQEIDRYNMLLTKVRAELHLLRKGIKGLVVMSADLDTIFGSLLDGQTPVAWKNQYPSLKPLGPWMRDLIDRVDQLNVWGNGMYPTVYWMGGFTYPTGFLTAVLQTAARKQNIGIDALAWEFAIVPRAEKDLQGPPKDGVYVKGIVLEGAGWDVDNGCLREPNPMELNVLMPIIHFKPAEVRKKAPKGIYQCPCYLYPIRTGSRERPSYTITVDLKQGSGEPEHWIKRGTALLLSLAD